MFPGNVSSYVKCGILIPPKQKITVTVWGKGRLGREGRKFLLDAFNLAGISCHY
jgi:hypothetical protein